MAGDDYCSSRNEIKWIIWQENGKSKLTRFDTEGRSCRGTSASSRFTGTRSEIVAGDEVGARKTATKFLTLQATRTTKSTQSRFDM
jgi:hypothetical protein